jgi:excisionase family DNA binding protein
MSAEFAQSIKCQRVLPSGKPLEFQQRTDPPSVHSVPTNPSVSDRFGAYLVPSLPTGPLFTVKELASRWRVCTATIYTLAKTGKLESLRIGNSIRFMETTIAAYEQTRIGAKPERQPGIRRER